MALSIKDSKAEALIRELAKVKQTTLTGALREAASNELYREKLRGSKDLDARWAAIREIQRRSKALPVLDDRSDDEILGYGDDGLPT